MVLSMRPLDCESRTLMSKPLLHGRCSMFTDYKFLAPWKKQKNLKEKLLTDQQAETVEQIDRQAGRQKTQFINPSRYAHAQLPAY